MRSEPIPEPVEAVPELRMLRGKAYGQGEGLSSEELARLRELEGWDAPGADASAGSAVGAVDASAGSAVGAVDASTGSAAGSVDASAGSAVGSEVSVPEPQVSVPEPVEGRPRRWPLVALTALATLAVGFGVGWAIWGWDSEAAALVAAHGDMQAEIEAEHLYDAGTVIPVAEKHGVVVWRADRSDGEEFCVIVTGPKHPQHGCVPTEDLTNSLWPNATATVPDGEEKAGQQLTAGLIPTVSGQLVPFIQIWDQSQMNWEAQYTESELEQLRSVEAAGYMGSALNILGHDGDAVVWSTWETGVLCMIVPTGGDGFGEACAENSESTVSIDVRVDGIPTRYVATPSDRRSPQLTIYKDVDAEYYFGADEPQFDDFFTDSSSIDDKTGR